jgi:hypothetical protein
VDKEKVAVELLEELSKIMYNLDFRSNPLVYRMYSEILMNDQKKDEKGEYIFDTDFARQYRILLSHIGLAFGSTIVKKVESCFNQGLFYELVEYNGAKNKYVFTKEFELELFPKESESMIDSLVYMMKKVKNFFKNMID